MRARPSHVTSRAERSKSSGIIRVQAVRYVYVLVRFESKAIMMYVVQIGVQTGCAYVHVRSAYSAEYGSTGNGCHSCSRSAEQGKLFFPCPRSCLRRGSAAPSRASPLILHTQAESDWLVLTHGISPAFRDGVIVHLYRQPSSCQSLLEFIGSRICGPMAFAAESAPAQGHKSSR